MQDEVDETSANKNKDEKIPSHEKHLVHYLWSVPQYNPQTGENEAVVNRAATDPKLFERMEDTGAFAGIKVEILHSPTNSDAEDLSEADYLIPQIVSPNGAGVPLSKTLQEMTPAQLEDTYKKFFPETKDEDLKGYKKENYIQEIGERAAVLLDKKATEEYAQIELTRLNAAGYVLVDDKYKA